MQGRPLYGYEIKEALGNIPNILSADQVSYLQGPTLAVCNTSDAGTSGTHWIAVSIDHRNRGECFDPFGLHPILYGHSDSMEDAREWT